MKESIELIRMRELCRAMLQTPLINSIATYTSVHVPEMNSFVSMLQNKGLVIGEHQGKIYVWKSFVTFEMSLEKPPIHVFDGAEAAFVYLSLTMD